MRLNVLSLAVVVALGGCAADVESLRLLEDGPPTLAEIDGPAASVLPPEVIADLEALGIPLEDIGDDVLTGYATAAASRPISVSLVTPSADSRTATPLSSLTLLFSHKYSNATVNSTTVKVFERESLREVPVTFNTSANQVVVVTPSRPLSTGARYHIVVDGVVGNNGAPVTYYDGRFFTQFHFQSFNARYRENGDVIKWIDGTYDTAGSVWNALSTYAGADGVMGTADDRENYLSKYFRDALGDNHRLRVHRDTGPDGVYETADDEYQYERTLKWNGLGLEYLSYTNPGPDGQFGTGDEYLTAILPRHYDAEDRLEYNCRQDGSGVTQSCTQIIYGIASKEQFGLVDPGPDGLWSTADDTPADDWRHYSLDANGLASRVDTYDLDASGGRTPSDALRTAYTLYTRTGSGLATESRSYDGAGPDGTWGTADDAATKRIVTTFDGSGFSLTQDSFEAGPDAVFGSVDDWQFQRREW